MRKSLKVAEGQRKLKDLEENEGSLKTVEEIRRRMNKFDGTICPGRFRELEESRRSLKKDSRRWKKAAEKRAEGRFIDGECE
jgi:hypothetical protein